MYTTKSGITRLAPMPVGSIKTYTVKHGACWPPGVTPTSDVPAGFTDSGSLLLYFQIGPAYAAFNAVYSMSWVSRHNALAAFAPYDTEIPPEPCGVLYASVGYAPSAWYCLERLQVPPPFLTPLVQPMLSAAECSKLGLGWVAIALSTPYPPPSPTYGSCYFPFPSPLDTAIEGKLTKL